MSEDDASNNGDDGLYIVERILDKRRKGGVAQYFIKWRGYDKPEDNTWEPVENCDCPDLIKEFEEKLAAKKRGKKDSRQSVSSRSTATPTPAETAGGSARGQRRTRTLKSTAPQKKIKLTSSRVIMDSSSDSDSSDATPPPAQPAEKSKAPEKTASPSKKTPAKKKKTPSPSPTRARTTSEAASTDVAPVAPADVNGNHPTGLAAAITAPFVPTRVPELIPPVTENGETRALLPLRPSGELGPLEFKVTKVNGIYNDNGYLMAVVSCDKDEDYRCVELKAVGRQDLDMLVDFLVTRLEV